MDEIELVVKIPEDVYRYAKKYNGSSMSTLREREVDMCMNAIANGIPLPKEHGRLVDAEEVGKYVIIGNADLRKCPTVIVADKED